MHNCYRIVCTQEVGDELSIAKVVRIISICQLVEVNHLPSAGLEPMQNKVSAEETGTVGDENSDLATSSRP